VTAAAATSFFAFYTSITNIIIIRELLEAKVARVRVLLRCCAPFFSTATLASNSLRNTRLPGWYGPTPHRTELLLELCSPLRPSTFSTTHPTSIKSLNHHIYLYTFTRSYNGSSQLQQQQLQPPRRLQRLQQQLRPSVPASGLPNDVRPSSSSSGRSSRPTPVSSWSAPSFSHVYASDAIFRGLYLPLKPQGHLPSEAIFHPQP
jgi:hypothetical protein